jgi:hypothetical protein
MQWLLRYARYSGVHVSLGADPGVHLRRQFSAPAWRLIHRSGREPLRPLIANQRLGWSDLQAYVDRLVEMGFQVAPAAHLVQHVVDQSYLYFDEPPDPPMKKRDLILIRVALRSGVVSRREFALVLEWVISTAPRIHERRVWAKLVREAALWRAGKAVEEHSRSREPWAFALQDFQVFGLEFVPLRTPYEMWLEGVAMGSCLHALCSRCGWASTPSRFFSVRRGQARVATVEIQRISDTERWFMRDVRLSYNRLAGVEVVCAAEELAVAYDRAVTEERTAGQAATSVAAARAAMLEVA